MHIQQSSLAILRDTLSAYAGNIISYLLEVRATDSSGFVSSTTPLSNNATLTLPTCCTGYSFTVAARTSVGFGPRSLPITFRTPAEMTRESRS